jgi:hypothetical protein
MGSKRPEFWRVCFESMADRQKVAKIAKLVLLRALHISDRDDPINEVIAQRILEGARAGVRDPNALRKMAVKDRMVP